MGLMASFGAGSTAAMTLSSGAGVLCNSTQNTLPWSTVLSMPITPSLSSTNCLVTTRPMPVPATMPASWPKRLKG